MRVYKIKASGLTFYFSCRCCRSEPQADVQDALKNTEKSETQKNQSEAARSRVGLRL